MTIDTDISRVSYEADIGMEKPRTPLLCYPAQNYFCRTERKTHEFVIIAVKLFGLHICKPLN
jgi:hypothetical protein